MALIGYHFSDYDRLLWARPTGPNMDTKSIEEYFAKDNFAPMINELPHGAIVFDIGAYIGTYALRIEVERPDLRIFSFEPEPYNYGMLVRNLNLNNSKVIPLQYAISDQSGFIDLTKGEHNGSWSSIFYKGEGPEVSVYGITIEEAMQTVGITHIDYVKIDVEGAEEQVINSIPPYVMHQLVGMELELHDDLPNHIELKILMHLRSCGFRPNVQWKPIGPKVDLRKAR